MSKGTIIISGGCGYIGSHTVVDILQNTDYNVISIDNFSNSDITILQRIYDITGKRITNYAIDICDEAAVYKALEGKNDIVGIIHFAAFKSVPHSIDDPIAYFQNNFNTLFTLLKFATDKNVKNFIFSSSATVYGEVEHLPVKEESIKKFPSSPYGYTKYAAEDIVKQICDYKSLKAISLRYFNPAGAHISGLLGELPKGRPANLVPAITQTAIGKIESLNVFGTDYPTRDGSCIRDYIHVSDIAHAHVLALKYLINKNDNQFYDNINLGSGNGVSVLEAINAFEKVSGVKLKYQLKDRRQGDVAEIYSDSKKAKSVLNWEPKHSLEDMMLSAWRWEQNLNRCCN